jgi:hypothetical protein
LGRKRDMDSITRLGTRRETTNHGRHVARELESCVEVPL